MLCYHIILISSKGMRLKKYIKENIYKNTINIIMYTGIIAHKLKLKRQHFSFIYL